MKKLAIILISLILLCSNLYALSSSSNMTVSAYKGQKPDPSNPNPGTTDPDPIDPPDPIIPPAVIPTPLCNIVVTDLTTNTSLGQTYDRTFDITQTLEENKTISNLFSIYIESNLDRNINVTVTLSPFVNQSQKTDIIPVSYSNETPTTSGPVAGSQRIGWGQETVGRTKYYYNYFAEYTPRVSVLGMPNSAINTGKDVTITLTPDYTCRLGKQQTNKQYQENYNQISFSSSNRDTIDSKTRQDFSTRLPGFANSQVVSANIIFGISITEEAINNMQDGADYAATIIVLVETS